MVRDQDLVRNQEQAYGLSQIYAERGDCQAIALSVHPTSDGTSLSVRIELYRRK